jgi:hypothetical protein
MAEIVEIRGAGGQVRIEVLEYERPDATDTNESNRLTCKCSVEVWEFACNLNLSLAGAVVVNTSEEGFRLEVIIARGGHADVFGYAQSNRARPSRTVLAFSFESDQSFLSQTNRELEKILQHFPVR